jgi:hypothetical protein
MLMFLFVGCTTQKRCNRLYPPIESKKDSVNIQKEVVLKDTTIYKTLPPDTVTIEKNLPANSPNFDPVIAENQYAFAMAWANNGVFYLLLHNKPQPFAFTLQNKTTKESYHRNQSEVKVKQIRYIPKLFKWCAIIISWQIVAGLVYAALWIAKKFY